MANIMARCIAVHEIVGVTMLKDLSEDNMFSTSSSFHALLAEVLRIVMTLDKCTLDTSKELYKELKIDFSEYLMIGPREDKSEALNTFLKKHGITDVVV